MPKDDWKGKKTFNIRDIELLNQQEIHDRFGSPIPSHADGKPLATVVFKFPCKYTTFTISELLDILRKWFIAEELRYPTEFRYKGEYFFEEVKKVFKEAKIKTDETEDGQK